MRIFWPVALARTLVAGCAVVVTVWAGCPWPGTLGLALLGAFAIAAELFSTKLPAPAWKLALALAWMLSLVVPATPLLMTGDRFSLDDYTRYHQALLAWLVAAVVLPVAIPGAHPRRLRLPAMACAFVGGTLWLAAAWSGNLRGVFYLGLADLLGLLVLLKLWFRLPGPAILTANTLVLLILGLGAVDLFVPPPERLDPRLATARAYYSYENARKDPLAFERWWNYYLDQWLRMSKAIITVNRHQRPTFYLRPGSHGEFSDCPIAINSLGFRGGEIAREKGKAYRIVALGESTTFGCTLGRWDKPWPKLLGQMIRERLKPRRPVEVINAGVPSYTLEDNLNRLARDVLPLKPDMIISYHGYNGFPLLEESLPVVHGKAPPAYRARPLRLLAKCEYRLKMWYYRRHPVAHETPPPETVSDVMKTDYARDYRELVRIAETNHIRLVLANFSMAVNAQSDPDVIDFYRAEFPLVDSLIDANRLHSELVLGIARQNPDVCFVDTHPHLDGVHDKFVDLVHLTQAGRQQLCETIFAGIRQTLERDLSPVNVKSGAP